MTGSRTRPAGSQRPSAGFTLIELMLVLTIIGVLLSIALPRHVASVNRSAEVVLRHNLKVTRQAIDQYRADIGAYPPSLGELVRRGYLTQLPHDPVLDRNDRWLLERAPQGGIADLHSGAAGVDATGRDLRDL